MRSVIVNFVTVALSVFGLSVLAGWWLTTWATPRVIQNIAMDRMVKLAGGANKMIQAPPASPATREVVRPSPDLLYSICAYDLSSGDVAVRIGPTDGYWSVSGYDDATDNYHVASYRDHGAAGYAFRLSTNRGSGNSRGIVVSPTERGVLLVRRRIADEASLVAMQESQKVDSCENVSGN